MQHYEIQKLRKRLKNHGYSNISIIHVSTCFDNYIYLTCNDPIFGYRLAGRIPFSEISKIPLGVISK